MISPSSPASIAPASADFSHGCATAVGIGSRLLHLSRSFSYFPEPVCEFIILLVAIEMLRAPPARSLSARTSTDGQDDAGQQRLKRGLVVLERRLRGSAGDRLQDQSENRPKQAH